jgi:predicted lipid-binding transport protein (Tim44 family)
VRPPAPRSARRAGQPDPMSRFGGWRGIGRALLLAWGAGLSAKLFFDLFVDASHGIRVAIGLTARVIGLVAGLLDAFTEGRRRERDQVAFEQHPGRPQIS